MSKTKHCKWYNDELCTNGDSPCVADYCPVVEYPELCKCRETEFSNDIKVRSKSVPNEIVQHYEEEIEELELELSQSLKVVSTQKAEIERLTEERNKYKGLYETMYRKWSDLQDKEFNCEALRKERNEYLDKAVELQKQVDELKELNAKYLDSIESLTVGKCVLRCELTKQAVKDTAKELLDKAIIIDKNTGNKGFICIEALTELCKSKGVEVE